jgi:hypothetical protein
MKNFGRKSKGANAKAAKADDGNTNNGLSRETQHNAPPPLDPNPVQSAQPVHPVYQSVQTPVHSQQYHANTYNNHTHFNNYNTHPYSKGQNFGNNNQNQQSQSYNANSDYSSFDYYN